MGVSSFKELMEHVGHRIVVVTYGKDEPVNVAIECEDCHTVLLDFNRPGDDGMYPRPTKKYPDWVVDLYKGQDIGKLSLAYLETAVADLTDDVDCSPSTLTSRSQMMTYLAAQIGESVTGKMDQVAVIAARETGYASGVPFER